MWACGCEQVLSVDSEMERERERGRGDVRDVGREEGRGRRGEVEPSRQHIYLYNVVYIFHGCNPTRPKNGLRPMHLLFEEARKR